VRSPNGAFTTFDAPGAGTGQFQGTEGEGINPQETVSGYDIDAGGVAHGYVRAKDGAITTFDAPGSTGTLATAINPSGVITGAFSDTNGVTHGFLRIP
jgi:hypothetical protein